MSSPVQNDPFGQNLTEVEIDSELKDHLAYAWAHTGYWCKWLFPERFEAQFSKLHDQIFDLIDSGAPKIAIAAPRGIGKTSIVGLGLASKKIIFKDEKFLVYVSNSATSAELQTENLKMELASNQDVKKLIKYLYNYDSIKIKTDESVAETFSKRAWVAMGNTLVFPRGSGQQIRGLLYKNDRPGLFIIDDLEDTDTLDNEEIRLKRKTWFFSDLLKATSRIRKDWQIVYIDTVKHEDSLLEELLAASDWESLRLELCDDEFNSNAPEFISTEEIIVEAAQHREKGLMDVFYREFRNIPISKEDAIFKDEYFKYYDTQELLTKTLETVVIADPAKTVKMHSAESAIVGIGLDLTSSRIYMMDLVHAKLYPDEFYDELFSMAARLKSHVVGVEVTSLHQFITQPIKNKMVMEKARWELVELNAQGKKEDRIKQLAPYYRQGFIYHPSSGLFDALEAQLMMFPRSALWDIMDAAAYLIKLMDIGDRFFEVASDDEDDDAYYSEVEDYEAPVEGWRLV